MNTATIQFHDVPTFVDIDRAVTRFGVIDTQKATGEQASPTDRVQKVISIFAIVRPLLVAISALPIIPNSWRMGVQLFVTALDALAAGSVVSGDFKAGKDL
jgi:hypothetical protein